MSRTQIIAGNDPRLSWRGQVSLEPDGDGYVAWRIPYRNRGLFPGVEGRAHHAVGVHVCFQTDAATLAIRATYDGETTPKPAEVVVEDEPPVQVDLSKPQEVELPGRGLREVVIWLPHWGRTALHGIELPAEATVVRAEEDERPRWITYGSSITMCRVADAPTRPWPVHAAEESRLALLNLGFGGQCHLDPMVARLVRDQPADYLSACLGINIHGAGSMTRRTFEAGIIGFVEIVRERHVDTPLCLISPIFSPPREDRATTDMTLRDMRKILANVVDRFRARGDEALHYVNGLDLFGPDSLPDGADLKTLMPDDLHPSDAAQPILADNVKRHVLHDVFGVG
jgi:hypothetical protein